MSKKLLIAVLTLGFLFTLSGAAFSTGGSDQEGELKPWVDPAQALDHPELNAIPIDLDEVFTRPIPLGGPPSYVPLAAGKYWPPPTDCEYMDPSEGNYEAAWPVPEDYASHVWYNSFISTASGNIGGTVACTLATATIGFNPNLSVGDPDLVVIVYDYPYTAAGEDWLLTERARVTIPFASLPAPGSGPSFVTVDLRTIDGGNAIVYEDGAAYRIGVSVTEPDTDTIFILCELGPGFDGTPVTNAPTNTRFCAGDLGGCGWWYGPDWQPQLSIASEVCCADLGFSECRDFFTFCPQASLYLWGTPDRYGYKSNYNQLFYNKGPDTLKEFGVGLHNAWETGTPILEVTVWGDVGGFPDESNVIYTATRPHNELVYYPGFNVFDVSGDNMVLREDFHIGVGAIVAEGDTLWCVTDDGYCGHQASSFYNADEARYMTFWEWYEADMNMMIYAHMCKDEFSDCQVLSDYCNEWWIYSLPNSGANGRIACYQRLDPIGLGCRLEKVKIMTYSFGDPTDYGHASDIEIRYADGSGVDGAGDPVDGVPGTFIASWTVNPGEYVDYPGWNEWDVTSYDIRFGPPLWVGIKTHAPWDQGYADYFVQADSADCPTGKSVGYYNDGVDEWWTHFAVNFWITGDVCCIPAPERFCEAGLPERDWPTSGHDFRRSGAGFNSTGDARCTQALHWMVNDPAGCIYTRPAIYDGMVLIPFNNKLQAYDLASGALVWTITGLPEMGINFRNSVTCQDGFVYFGGGSGRSFNKADIYTGATIWSRNVLNDPLVGNTTYTNSVILTCDEVEVIFLTTNFSEVYALETATGANFGGWAVNPLIVDGDILQGLSSNGIDVIYVSTDHTGSGNGTFYAVDACTGVVNWSLGAGDLAGPELSGVEDAGEAFRNGAAVDVDGSIYFQTYFYNTEGAPSGGRYRVDPDGNIEWAKGGKYTGFCTPVLDGNMVLFTAIRGWTSENNSTVGCDKNNGAPLWESELWINGSNWIEGALSCEPGIPDLYYQGNRDWQFMAINADDGTIEFDYTYVNTGSERGMGAAIDPTYVVFNNRQGDLYVFSLQEERPRLRILTWDELAAVPFFSPDGYIVTFEDAFMNNGCVNLTGTLSADENPPPAYAWTVNPERISRMQDVASGMVDNTFADMAENLVKAQRVNGSELDAEFSESPYARDSYSNMGAYGPPAWLNNIQVTSFDLAEGQTFDVVYDVNGPLVSRGPQRCYVTIATNDNYFLNAPGDPVVQLGVLGGCLEAYDILYFGTSEQNFAPVFSTGEIGSSRLETLEFDGDHSYFQGGLFFAAEAGEACEPPFSLAWNTEGWTGEPDDFWNSLLPDPNCFDQCEPYVTDGPVLLGAMSHDGGLTYDDVMGYASTAAYIDSVIDFDCYGTGWDFDNVECPYDNDLTMGFRVEESMYGVIGEPDFNNVVIYKLDVTNRNADPVEVFVGAFNDFDLEDSPSDLCKFDAAHSIAYCASCMAADLTLTEVYGMGKVPMDDNPMIGTRTMDGDQAMFGNPINSQAALDSMYWYMSEPSQAGETYQAGIQATWPCTEGSPQDRDAWCSLVGYNFAGFETYTFATYLFGFVEADITDDQSFFDLAVKVNQLCGFGRGDINIDGVINLADVVALYNMGTGGPGPLFRHLADVNADGSVDNADILYLANYHFDVGPAPVGDWTLPNICP